MFELQVVSVVKHSHILGVGLQTNISVRCTLRGHVQRATGEEVSPVNIVVWRCTWTSESGVTGASATSNYAYGGKDQSAKHNELVM